MGQGISDDVVVTGVMGCTYEVFGNCDPGKSSEERHYGREEKWPLLIIWTAIRLSEWIRMDLLVHSEPQRWAATTMGYSSESAEERRSSGGKDSSSGHLAANHFPP